MEDLWVNLLTVVIVAIVGAVCAKFSVDEFKRKEYKVACLLLLATVIAVIATIDIASFTFFDVRPLL